MFVCDYHKKVLETPIPGIDRPPHADELWRGSIDDCVKLALIKLQHADQNKTERENSEIGFVPILARQNRYAPAQRRSIMALRAKSLFWAGV
jgi:hypothetical protein